jgi:hypothetical protein
MKYTTNNIQISLTVALAAYLREQGYDIYWHTAGTRETQTAGLSEARGIVTLVPDFPADPVFILPANPDNVQRLKSESTTAEEVVVPALSLQVLGSPKRGNPLGLGHADYEWTREVRVDGLAADQYQHREIADLLFDWLTRKESQRLPVLDYDNDPANPQALDPVEVLQDFTNADRQELIHEVEAIRYYVRTTTRISYVE